MQHINLLAYSCRKVNHTLARIIRKRISVLVCRYCQWRWKPIGSSPALNFPFWGKLSLSRHHHCSLDQYWLSCVQCVCMRLCVFWTRWCKITHCQPSLCSSIRPQKTQQPKLCLYASMRCINLTRCRALSKRRRKHQAHTDVDDFMALRRTISKTSFEGNARARLSIIGCGSMRL